MAISKKQTKTIKKKVMKHKIPKKEVSNIESLPINMPEEFSKPHKLILVLSCSFLAFAFSLLMYLYISNILYLNLIFVFLFSLLASRVLAKQKKKSSLCCSCSGCLIGVVSSVFLVFILLFLFMYNLMVYEIVIYFISALIIGGISCYLGSKY